MKKKWTPLRIVQFCCICSAGLLYYVPYGFSVYYDTFIEAFNVNNAQLGTMQSAYTVVAMFTYFFGGIVADKFSARKLLAFSYITTGALTFWFGTFPRYEIAVLIMALMGLIATVTFFAAMLKSVRIFTGEGNEGMGMGLLEGVRNLLSSVFATVGLLIFGRFASNIAGLRAVIMLFATVVTLVGVLILIVLEKDVPQKAEKGGLLKNIKTCLKDPNVWIMSLVLLFLYVANVTIRYMTPFATGVFGISIAMGALLGNFREYMRPFGAIAAGYISEKLGVTKSLIAIAATLCVINFSLSFMPQQAQFAFLVFIGTAVGWVLIGAARGLYFAPIGEAKIPMALTGTVIGIMSTVGYIPDAIMPIIVGKILDNNPPETAYPLIFNIAGVSLILGIITLLIFYRRNKDNILEMNARKREEIQARKAAKLASKSA